MNTKIHTDSIAIEVTRRCNMSCPHCLRGDSQNKDLSSDILRNFLSQIASIGSILFTGGEPTLNIAAIQETLDYCKEHKIPVSEFYIVTNGKELSDDFLILMVRWYTYCIECGGEPDFCGLALSQDIYHEPINPMHMAKLRALSFFRPDDKDTRKWSKPLLLNMGRARHLQNAVYQQNTYITKTADIDLTMVDDMVRIGEATITLTAEGQVLTDCDYEYENTDNVYLCEYDKLAETTQQIYRAREPFPCDNETCFLNPKGQCIIPKLYDRQPRIEEDGCLDYINQEERSNIC